MGESSYTKYHETYYRKHKEATRERMREYMRTVYYPKNRKKIMKRVKAWRVKQKLIRQAEEAKGKSVKE